RPAAAADDVFRGTVSPELTPVDARMAVLCNPSSATPDPAVPKGARVWAGLLAVPMYQDSPWQIPFLLIEPRGGGHPFVFVDVDRNDYFGIEPERIAVRDPRAGEPVRHDLDRSEIRKCLLPHHAMVRNPRAPDPAPARSFEPTDRRRVPERPKRAASRSAIVEDPGQGASARQIGWRRKATAERAETLLLCSLPSQRADHVD